MRYIVLVNDSEYAFGVFETEEEARQFAIKYHAEAEGIMVEEAELDLENDSDPARVIELIE